MINQKRRWPRRHFRLGFLGVVIFLIGCSKPPPKPQGEPQADSVKEQSSSMPDNRGEIRTPAQVGVGKRGQKLKDRNGMLSTPAKQIFVAEQKIMFMKADQALQAFEILNDRYPRSTKEYMDRVINANFLTLPELPAGDRYEFDTKTHKLMVIQGGMTEDAHSK